jgi:hypothetical protein
MKIWTQAKTKNENNFTRGSAQTVCSSSGCGTHQQYVDGLRAEINVPLG